MAGNSPPPFKSYFKKWVCSKPGALRLHVGLYWNVAIKCMQTASTTTTSLLTNYSVTHWKIWNWEIISVFFCLEFVNQLHHRATANKHQKVNPTANSLCCLTSVNLGLHNGKRPNTGYLFTNTFLHLCWNEWVYLGSRKSKATEYSLGFVLPCKQRRFQPTMMPSRLPKMLSTSHGKMPCSSFRENRHRKLMCTIPHLHPLEHTKICLPFIYDCFWTITGQIIHSKHCIITWQSLETYPDFRSYWSCNNAHQHHLQLFAIL